MTRHAVVASSLYKNIKLLIEYLKAFLTTYTAIRMLCVWRSGAVVGDAGRWCDSCHARTLCFDPCQACNFDYISTSTTNTSSPSKSGQQYHVSVTRDIRNRTKE